MTDGPAPRRQTIRDALRAQLVCGWQDARQLSEAVGLSEKAVPEHLEHLRKSASRSTDRFEVEPASCHGCGYRFSDRTRLDRPSRCPRCRSERIEPPRYRIVGLDGDSP